MILAEAGLTAIQRAPEQILLHRKALKLLVTLQCQRGRNSVAPHPAGPEPVLVSVPTPWLIYNCDKSPEDNQGAVTLLQLNRKQKNLLFIFGLKNPQT